MDTPISLEDLRYLHIISHLEDYPIHDLAKLSHHVRTRLLQNLPASDIIELENTCVADGIGDFKTRYAWKQSSLCKHYKQEPRQSFFSTACLVLFSSYYEQLFEMLFSVPECLGIANLTSFTSVACNDLDRLVPHRYAALFDRNVTSLCDFHARVITLLNKAGFKPTKIHTNGGFAIDANSQYLSDLSILVSSVETVELIVQEDQATLSIIKAICMNKNAKLRSFTTYDREFTQKCVSLILEASIIGLERLRCPIPVNDCSGCKCLEEFLCSQTNIKELGLLFGADYKIPDDEYCKHDQWLLSCAGSLFLRPNFEHFLMIKPQMTLCALTVLLNSFLLAPASKQKKVVADGFDVEICSCHAQKAVMPLKVGSNSLEYKEVSFTGDYAQDYSGLDPLFKCLSNFEIQLKRLVFENYTLEDINLFTAVFSSSTFAVREVRLWWVEFPTLSSESDFHILDELLSKPCLKDFEFSGI